MSLLSQKDREMAIEALEFFINKTKQDDNKDIQSYNALLNWIRLEHYKNE